MSVCKKIGLALVLIIVLLAGGLLWLAGSHSGLNTLTHLASRWVPGFSVARVDGNLWDLTLHDLRYQRAGIDLQAGSLSLAVSRRCLLRGQVCIGHLTVDNARLQLTRPPSAAPPASKPATGAFTLSAPLPVTLNQLSLQNFQLEIDGNQLLVRQLRTGMRWRKNNITVLPSTLQGMTLRLAEKTPTPARQPASKSSDLLTAAPQSVAEKLKQVFSAPLFVPPADMRLPVNLTIEQFTGEQLRIIAGASHDKAPVNIQRVQLQVSTMNGVTQLHDLQIDSDYGELQVSGQLHQQADWRLDLTLNSRLNLTTLLSPPQQTGATAKTQKTPTQAKPAAEKPAQEKAAPASIARLHLAITGALADKLRFNGELSGALTMQLQGETELARAGLPFHLLLTSQQLRLPLQGEAQYQLNKLRFQADGKATDYQLKLHADMQSKPLARVQLALQAQGNEQQLRIGRLQLSALQGSAQLQGVLDWQKALSMRADIQLAGIDSGKQFPDWPVRLDGNIRLRASAYGGGWQLSVPEMQINGNVKQKRLTLSGKFTGNSYQQWNIANLRLALGDNQLAIHGQAGVNKLALDASIRAPTLDDFLPGLAGNVQGMLKLSGTVNAPQLASDINVRGLRWQDLTIGELHGQAALTRGKHTGGRLQLSATQISQGSREISQLTLTASGDEQAHQLHLQVQGKPVSAVLNLRGSYSPSAQRWQGTLYDAQVGTPVGNWTAASPIALDYAVARQQLAVAANCWQNPHGQLCMSGRSEIGKQGHVRLDVKQLDLAIIKPFLPPGTQISGKLISNADLRWDAGKQGLPEGSITLSGQQVSIRQTVDNNPLQLAFSTLDLHVLLANNMAQLGWLVRIVDNGQFAGKLRIADPAVRRTLSGEMSIQHISLAAANALLSQGGKVAGQINGNLQVAGSLRQPQLSGNLNADGLKLEGNFMPFDMQPGQLALVFHGMSSSLQGVIRTAQGQISLQGNADWHQLANWSASVSARGERVRISVPPVVRLDVSPDVRLDASAHSIRLTGNIQVPWARITVHELPESAVKVSDDVVMLNDQLQPIHKRSASIPIHSDLKIHVGDDVRLDAFGLKARLTGNLLVTQNKQGLGLSGQIDIPEGRFRAYGQDLLVRRGELLFSGSPDHVLLDVEAIRNPQSTEDNVIAGVRVSGSSDQPKVEVFSDPAMSQQEALSYLLRGQGLQSQQSDSAAMTSVLIGLGVAQSGRIIGKIGETFGINNLMLDTESVGNSSQVVLSGYVLPGLQVKYGVGIFDSLATLTLRYRLLPKLYLEAVSGVDQALDLLYQFEF